MKRHHNNYSILSVWTERCPPIRPGQAITIAACLTAIVTLLSLNELQTLIAAGDSAQHAAYLPSHGDWRTVEQIAARAVAHVEHLPSRVGHANVQPLHTGGGDGGGVAGAQGVLLQPDSLPCDPPWGARLACLVRVA